MPSQVTIDAPLTTWYCDECGGAIVRYSPGTAVEQTGVVAWQQPVTHHSGNPDKPSQKSPATEYKVLHKIKCDTDRSDATWEVETLLGIAGLQRWSELLWNGPAQDSLQLSANASLHPTLDLLYRFQVPYYEQARQYLRTQSAQEIIGGRAVLEEKEWQQIITEGSREIEEGL
ncbi:hypothetical protein WBN73_20960 [Paenarthrobacter sp. CCNWLY172]|uniref:hypothetical protein n=1 Tax=unclassified Paenarthrobacter TaxID=2634190 RepID=UPI0030780466